MIRLHDFLSSGNGYKCRLLLHQLGLPFERIELDILKGETRTPEFLAKNPNGRIPALELEDGTVLAESDAILFYLAEGTPFLPEGRLERAQVLQWLFFEQYSHEPFVAVARFIRHLLPEDSPRRAELPRLEQGGHAALGVMERRLAEHPFLVADRYTIADIALYAYTHVADEGGFDLEPYPGVRAWLARVAGQPRHVPITAG
ncbi:MAG TPA: glutathione S-transferase family protein [Geminicoccaceae bacterium]|nr:glutathione S-transferase family protein [Geminicoccaceae bacterium]